MAIKKNKIKKISILILMLLLLFLVSSIIKLKENLLNSKTSELEVEILEEIN